jgi:hypothetical protein
MFLGLKKMASRKTSRHLSFFSVLLTLFFAFSLINPVFGQTRTARALKKETTGLQKISTQTVTTKKVTTQEKVAQKAPVQKSKPEQKPVSNAAILKENKFLEEELNLAKNTQFYFVINLKEKIVEIRARGVVLKSWAAGGIRYSGKPVPIKAAALIEKSTLNPPERKMIKPGENQEKIEKKKNQKTEAEGSKPESSSSSSGTAADTFELEALEITDMPDSYELILDNGLKISIRSKSGVKNRMLRVAEIMRWYAWIPVSNFLFHRKEPRPRLLLYFDSKRDAQGIYWAFIDGIKGLIWLP